MVCIYNANDTLNDRDGVNPSVGIKSEHASFYVNVKLLHMAVALVTDMFFLIHIYLKYIINWGLKIYAILKSYKDRRHLNCCLP